MSKPWKDLGVSPTIADIVFDIITLGHNPGENHVIQNTETGETKEISVSSFETVGEAIARGGDKFIK